MKVLVIDDAQIHLQSAMQTLVGHDVTVCSTHEKAVELLHLDRFAMREKDCNDPYWDAVLCDLLMPVGRMEQAEEGLRLVGQEMSVGWSLALSAAKKGAKFVAVVTDISHHYHPASAMLDYFNRHIFAIDGARVLMTNRVHFVGIVGTESPCTKCNGTGKGSSGDRQHNCSYCENGICFARKGKDWGGVLKKLLGEAPVDD